MSLCQPSDLSVTVNLGKTSFPIIGRNHQILAFYRPTDSPVRNWVRVFYILGHVTTTKTSRLSKD